MANNLYDKLINSEIPFLVLSSFCVYNFVTYSTKNRKVRNSKNEFTNLSIIEIDVHKEGKFGNVLSLLKRQQKRIDFKGKYVYKKPGKMKYLQRELEWYNKCWEGENDIRLQNYISKCHGTISSTNDEEHADIISLDNFLYKFYKSESERKVFNNLASSDIKIGTRSYEYNASTVGHINYWHKMLEFGTSWSSRNNNNGTNIFPSKLDFMKWRDESTTTKKYGFRITYMQHPYQDEEHYMYDPVKIQQGSIMYILQCFRGFFQVNKKKNRIEMLRKFIYELRILKDILEKSILFQSYNIIGSSLHFGYDYYNKNQLFLQWIDFSHATKLDKNEVKDDGLLHGISSLIELLKRV